TVKFAQLAPRSGSNRGASAPSGCPVNGPALVAGWVDSVGAGVARPHCTSSRRLRARPVRARRERLNGPEEYFQLGSARDSASPRSKEHAGVAAVDFDDLSVDLPAALRTEEGRDVRDVLDHRGSPGGGH